MALALGAAALVAALGVAPARGATTLRLSVGAANSRPIAPDFLGLALEYRTIPAWVGSATAVNPVFVQLIHNLIPTGQPVFRIGGQSTDRSWWPLPGARAPLGVTYALTPQWVALARALAAATSGRLILGVGLEANRPKLAAYEAEQLVAGIGPQYLDALELGNEPELYSVVPWYHVLHRKPLPWYSHDGAPVLARPRGWDPSAFDADFAKELALLPPVAVAGPSVGLVPWLDGFRRFIAPRSPVRVITWHSYGLNQCVTDPDSPDYPSVPNLLTLRASRNAVSGIGPVVALAHHAGDSFRIDEMGSVTCNGRNGVSDTFASALWVMDALFDIAGEGIDGVNVHTYQQAANGLFDFTQTAQGWRGTVHPMYYGLLMFAQAAPAGSRLLRVSSGPQGRLRAWATLAPDHRIRVLLINDSLRHTSTVRVRVAAAAGPGTVERLLARSAYATENVTLGGAGFGSGTATGTLPPAVTSAVALRGGAYSVTLPAATAALLTLAPRG